MCAKNGKNIQKEGVIHVFWGLLEQLFDAFCTLSEVRYLGCLVCCDVVSH